MDQKYTMLIERYNSGNYDLPLSKMTVIVCMLIREQICLAFGSEIEPNKWHIINHTGHRLGARFTPYMVAWNEKLQEIEGGRRYIFTEQDIQELNETYSVEEASRAVDSAIRRRSGIATVVDYIHT